MPSLLEDTLFSEPSGNGIALVHFGSAVVFTLILVWSWLRDPPLTNYWLVFMIVGIALAGVAEALPSERTRAAGVFRLAGIGTLVCLLGILVISPDVFV
jgi:peptidoglycan/LPS O-acetylase OafA/YrhL